MKEKFDPNGTLYFKDFYILPEGDNLPQELANIFLELIRSQTRFRKIFYNDRVVEVVYSTPCEAIRCVENLQLDDDGNFFLPTNET